MQSESTGENEKRILYNGLAEKAIDFDKIRCNPDDPVRVGAIYHVDTAFIRKNKLLLNTGGMVYEINIDPNKDISPYINAILGFRRGVK